MSPQIHLSCPVEIRFVPTWGKYVERRWRGDPTLSFDYEPSRRFGEKNDWGPRKDDYCPWEVRQDFLDGPLVDIKTFTYFYGQFGTAPDLKADRFDPHGRKDFQEWQRLIKDLVDTPVGGWKGLGRKHNASKLATASKPLPLRFEWKKDKPLAAIVRVRTALDAMIASVQIDKMRGVKSKYCAECGKEFSLTSAHERKYCTKRCAHRVAVREHRKRVAKRLTKTKHRLLVQSGERA
jgi:DNA-directed RNA polymerase subunit RPC12/RpoP